MAQDFPDWQTPRYLEMINQLVGFDNTTVNTAVVAPAWDLLKTITMTNFENKTMDKLTYTCRVGAAGNTGVLEFRYQIDAGPWTVFHNSGPILNTEWEERTVFIAPALENSTVRIRVYGNCVGGGMSVWNEKCECFGTVRQEIIYV